MVKVTTGDRSVLLHLLLCVVFLLINSYLSLVSHYVNNMQLIYENLPSDISGRHVLLLDPVLATGLNFHICTNIFFPKFLPWIIIIIIRRQSPFQETLLSKRLICWSVRVYRSPTSSSSILYQYVILTHPFFGYLKIQACIFLGFSFPLCNAGPRRDTCSVQELSNSKGCDLRDWHCSGWRIACTSWYGAIRWSLLWHG